MADPKWREFELLVARIEEWLGPKGAEVKSPDMLLDRITGELREVDASIRFQVGSAPILVTIECRDRVKIPDVRWIEQLVTQRGDIGAARTIVVSSTGFTKPARAKASHYGIEIRDIGDITEDVASQWAHNVKITLVQVHWDVVSLELRAHGVAPGNDTRGSLPPEIAEAFQKNPSDTKIGFERCSGKALTIRAMIAHACSEIREFTADLEVGKPSVRKTLTMAFPADSVAFYTSEGERDLAELKLTVDVRQTSESAPPSKVVRYESADGTILEVAQTDFEVEPDRRITMLYSQTRPADAPDAEQTDDEQQSQPES